MKHPKYVSSKGKNGLTNARASLRLIPTVRALLPLDEMKGIAMRPSALSALAGALLCFAVAAPSQAAPVSGVANLATSPSSTLQRVHYYYHHHRHHHYWWRRHHHYHHHY